MRCQAWAWPAACECGWRGARRGIETGGAADRGDRDRVAPLVSDIIVETLLPAARRLGDDHRAALAVVAYTFLLSMPFSIAWRCLPSVRPTYGPVRVVSTPAPAAPLAAAIAAAFAGPPSDERSSASPTPRLKLSLLFCRLD